MFASEVDVAAAISLDARIEFQYADERDSRRAFAGAASKKRIQRVASSKDKQQSIDV